MKNPARYTYDEAVTVAAQWLDVVSVGSLAGPISARFGIAPGAVAADIKRAA